MVKVSNHREKPNVGKKPKSKHKKEFKICNICYDEKNNKFTKCPKCEKKFCKNCWMNNYKLCSNNNSNCLNRECTHFLDSKFVFNNFPKYFMKDYFKKEKDKLVNFEKILIEQERNYNRNNNDFQFKCPYDGCKGFFYTNNYICTLCHKLVCNKCHKFNNDNHVCNSDDVDNITELLKDTIQCPCCKEFIHRINGCNAMYCTKCETHFNFITKKITGYRHNPHVNAENANNFQVNNNITKEFYENINNEIKQKLKNYDEVKKELEWGLTQTHEGKIMFSTFVFEKKYFYCHLRDILIVIDIESNIIIKIYFLPSNDIELIYVNHDRIFFTTSKWYGYNKYILNMKTNQDDKLIEYPSFKSNHKGKNIIKHKDKIIILNDNEITKYDLNQFKRCNVWKLPNEHLNNCRNFHYIENRNMFIFIMEDNLQFFEIKSDSTLQFLNVIVTKVSSISSSNSKYIIGVDKFKHKIYNEVTTRHYIIDIEKFKVVKELRLFGLSDEHIGFDNLYFEDDNTYYYYSKLYNRLKFFKIDIQKELKSNTINYYNKTVDFLDSSDNIYNFNPELKILMTIPISNIKKKIIIPYIYKFNENFDIFENVIYKVMNNVSQVNSKISSRYILNNVHDYNANIRNRYLRNLINENTFELKIKKNFTEFYKNKDIINIKKSIIDFYDSILKKYKNKLIENDKEIINELEKIQEKINQELEVNHKIYKGDKFAVNLFSFLCKDVFYKI